MDERRKPISMPRREETSSVNVEFELRLIKELLLDLASDKLAKDGQFNSSLRVSQERFAELVKLLGGYYNG